MEFEDEDREEEEEEEEEDEDDNEETATITTTTLLTPPYKTLDKKHPTLARYKECLKNHAVTLGGHAVDGCGEFMPAGLEGTLDSLKCAACNCHRNFHRKEHLLLDPTTNNNNNHQITVYTPRQPPQLQPPPPPHVFQFYPYKTPTRPPLSLPSTVSGGDVDEQVTGGMMTMTMTSSSGKKRHRTKFSQEQKDKMLGLAEKLGWRIQKQDELVVQQFCDETGVKRHVLKVWMHNNKHTLGKKPDLMSSPFVTPQP